jgi:hypothetical protein
MNSRGDDDHRRELAAEDRGEHWQQLRQGSARTHCAYAIAVAKQLDTVTAIGDLYRFDRLAAPAELWDDLCRHASPSC